MHKILKSRRRDLKVYIVENECSGDLKEVMNKYAIDFQLAPPNMHLQNTEERTIQTCKNDFISGFYRTDPYLPITKWDHLLSKCVITLNLLRNVRFNPDLSAYAYLYGPYNFIKYTMDPPGTCMIFHRKLSISHCGVILSHWVGVLFHHLTIINACSVTCLQLVLCVSLIHYNTSQRHSLS